MPSTPIRLLLAATLCVASTDALAQSLQWQVSESAGAVTIRHGSVERQATRGSVLESGDTVTTGANGRAVLVHERDFVTLAPRSRAAVPAAAQATGFTKLVQDLGNAVYKIEKRGVPHFGVNTPYLAAVVKGTTFSVTVDASGTSLQVVEGAVEVATPDGGARDLIRPGSVATIAAADTFRLRVHGDQDRVVDSPARHADGQPPAPVAPTASSGTTSAPQASVPAAAGATAEAPAVIVTAISSKPVDLGQFSGGLVAGTASVAVLTASVAQTAKPAPAVVAATAPVIASAAVVPVAATAPSAAAPAATVASQPVSTAPAVIAAVTTPVVTAPAATAPAVTQPTVTPPVATAAVAPPVVTAAVSTPVVSTPAVTTPAVTTAAVTTPAVTTPAVTTPAVTAPAVTIPAVTTPAVTAPAVTVAAVTSPATIIPIITTPIVTISLVTAPTGKHGIVIDPVFDDDSGKSNNGNHYGQQKNGKGH